MGKAAHLIGIENFDIGELFHDFVEELDLVVVVVQMVDQLGHRVLNQGCTHNSLENYIIDYKINGQGISVKSGLLERDVSPKRNVCHFKGSEREWYVLFFKSFQGD